jgi:ADP-heptose:LPS heptosyltransferase
MSAPGSFIDPRELRSILVIRRNRMGDMLYTVPLLKALRKAAPGAVIKALTEEAGALVAEASGAVDQVIAFPKKQGRWGGLIQILPRIWKCDLAIAVRGGFDSFAGWTAFLSGAGKRIGFNKNGSANPGWFFTHPVELPQVEEHQFERCARLLRPLGISQTPPDLKLNIPEKIQAWGRAYAAELESASGLPLRRMAVLNLSQPRPEKWPAGNWKELARRWLDSGGSVGFSCLPNEMESARQLAQELNSNRAMALETTTPLHLLELFTRVQTLASLEGGAGHLAASAGLPAVLLWPAWSNTAKWRPLGDHMINLTNQTNLADIKVEEVLAAMKKVCGV